ncbi:hypothetical protein BDZ91DRAFT_356069 [Kalaharituber pfeilii]|nr:hypothetical protein BDZ91DRAFT_356069 [Kalaharituber pfeilii]
MQRLLQCPLALSAFIHIDKFFMNFTGIVDKGHLELWGILLHTMFHMDGFILYSISCCHTLPQGTCYLVLTATLSDNLLNPGLGRGVLDISAADLRPVKFSSFCRISRRVGRPAIPVKLSSFCQFSYRHVGPAVPRKYDKRGIDPITYTH